MHKAKGLHLKLRLSNLVRSPDCPDQTNARHTAFAARHLESFLHRRWPSRCGTAIVCELIEPTVVPLAARLQTCGH